MSKCSTSAVLPRPVTMQNCSIPAARASSTAYWISGLSTTGSISLAIALVAGRKRVPKAGDRQHGLAQRLDHGCSILVLIALPLGAHAHAGRDKRQEAGAGAALHRQAASARDATHVRRGSNPQELRHPSRMSRAWLMRAASQSEPPLIGVRGAHQPEMRGADVGLARRRAAARALHRPRRASCRRAGWRRAGRSRPRLAGRPGRASTCIQLQTSGPSMTRAAMAVPPRPVRNSSAASSSPPMRHHPDAERLDGGDLRARRTCRAPPSARSSATSAEQQEQHRC